MGADMSCQFDIDKPPDGFFRSGDFLTGVLNYTVDKPTRYQKATLSLLGKATCKWEAMALYNSTTGQVTRTCSGEDTFLTMNLNILDEEVTLSPGTHRFRFQFVLPYDIPSTNKNKHSAIEYSLVANFVMVNYFTWESSHPAVFTVLGNVDPIAIIEPVTYKKQMILNEKFSNKEHKVVLQADMVRTFIKPGEDVEMELTVHNDTDIDIKDIKVRLMSKASYVSTGFSIFSPDTYNDHEEFSSSEVIIPSAPKNKVSKFTFVIPTLPEMYSIQHCKIIEKGYYVHVLAYLRFTKGHVVLVVPLVIGEGRIRESSNVTVSDDTDDENEDQTSTEDAPPSYWEVMNEDKLKTCDDKKEKSESC